MLQADPCAYMRNVHGIRRLGVLVEVNCETDFVARGDQFKELVSNIAMQVWRSPGCLAVMGRLQSSSSQMLIQPAYVACICWRSPPPELSHHVLCFG